MTVAAQLLDKAKERRSIPTDMALAARVGRSRQAVAQWRSGAKHPEDDMICELARLAEVDPAPYLVAAAAERSHGVAAKTWAALARQLGAAAAIACVAMFYAPIAPASVPEPAKLNICSDMHYAK
ncbi:hypothetical protein [Lysobacter sp. FW306-1B-D06B]|uniref:hypothetical protein n=1 Tax=Lysobacter sp. FW306-1B-D06B TaxID=3140250 RepID=UPI00313FF317